MLATNTTELDSRRLTVSDLTMVCDALPFLATWRLVLVRGLLQRADSERPAVPDDSRLQGETGDPTNCNYWRYCAIHGYLCACCGGAANVCPPGTVMSPITWLGTCRNPVDHKEYVIAYNDCCGNALCGRCLCSRTEGEQPVYNTFRNNDLLWCFGTQSRAVH